MKILRLPKTVRWVLGCALLLLVILNVYRLFLHAYFGKEWLEGPALWQSLWMGFRFDCRYAGGISLLVMLLGYLPGLHVFKRSAGKALGLTLYTVLTFGLLALMVVDFASLITYQTRVDASLLADLIRQTPRGRLVLKEVPLVTMLVGAGILSWIFYMVIRFMHHILNRSRSNLDKGMRIYWQALTISIFLICLHGRIGLTPLRPAMTRTLSTPYAQALALNPPEAVLGSMSAKPPANSFPKPGKNVDPGVR
jgi:hypothetical protein